MAAVNIPVVNATNLDNNEIITNDVVLPSQFFGERHPQSAEIKLVSAILVDAINCLFSQNKNRRTQAHAWFEDPLPGPFTYWDVCQWLSIDAEAFWSRLQKYIAEGRRVKRIRGHLVECQSMKPIVAKQWR